MTSLNAANDRIPPFLSKQSLDLTTRAWVCFGLILLKNSVFRQLSAFQRNSVPIRGHSENTIYQAHVRETVVPNSGKYFLAREFFNRIGWKPPLDGFGMNGRLWADSTKWTDPSDFPESLVLQKSRESLMERGVT